MYIAFNDTIVLKNSVSLQQVQRAVKYGDGFFETIRIANSRILFFETHLNRINYTASVLKMSMPIYFTKEFLKRTIELLIKQNKQNQNVRIRIIFFRNSDGYYTPIQNNTAIIIETEQLNSSQYSLNENGLQLKSFQDHLKPKTLLSELKTTNCLLYILAGIYKKEQNIDECVLYNTDKNIVETISANIFVITNDDNIVTPPIGDGCLNGIMRKQIINLCRAHGYRVVEQSFDIQFFDNVKEVFITNAIKGVQWVKQIDNKIFRLNISKKILDILNNHIV